MVSLSLSLVLIFFTYIYDPCTRIYIAISIQKRRKWQRVFSAFHHIDNYTYRHCIESSNTTKLNPDSQCYTFMHVTMSPSTYIISLNTRFFHKDSVNGRVMGVSAVGQRQWLQQLLRKSTLPSQLESNFSFLLSLAFCELDTSDLWSHNYVLCFDYQSFNWTIFFTTVLSS